jgi:predicted ATPase
VRIALDWAFSQSGDAALGMALTIAAIPLWFQLSLTDECRVRVQQAFASVVPGATRDAYARDVMQLYAALGLSRTFTTDWARRQEALSWELRGATSHARLWRDQDRGDEVHETEGGKEISSELIIARGDAAEVLEPTEAAFDDVAAFVCLFVMPDLR